MEVLHDAPTASSFTPLSIHQSQTPSSFFSGLPILYHHSPSTTLKCHTSDLASAPALSRLAEGAHRAANGTPAAVNGHAEAEEHDEELAIRGVDVWVTSERLILHSPTQSTGLSIPYPTITLHAIQTLPPSPALPTGTFTPPSLFLQLLTSAQTFDDHDPDSTISLTITPPPRSASSTDEMISRQAEEKVTTEELYTALSACANLHPDATSEPDDTLDNDDGTPPHHPHPAIRFEGDDNNDISGIYPLNNSYTESEGGGGASALPPPMPGSGGWITAENVGEFFDEEGNWRGGEEWTEREVVGVPGGGLGAGAGNVRGREEGGGGGGGGGVDEGDEGDETKWRRTE